jgi:hypothetical protein
MSSFNKYLAQERILSGNVLEKSFDPCPDSGFQPLPLPSFHKTAGVVICR